MNKYTVQDIQNLKPCYTKDKITELWNGKETLSAKEISELEISAEDRIWALIRLLDQKQQILFACDCAEHVLHLWYAEYPEDHRPKEALDVAMKYAEGKATEKELKAASDAAWDAARAASAAERDAAGDAVWAAASAAWDAASAAVWAAASAAVWAAATSAAGRAAASAAVWDAASAAERKWQLEQLVKYHIM